MTNQPPAKWKLVHKGNVICAYKEYANNGDCLDTCEINTSLVEQLQSEAKMEMEFNPQGCGTQTQLEGVYCGRNGDYCKSCQKKYEDTLFIQKIVKEARADERKRIIDLLVSKMQQEGLTDEQLKEFLELCIE